MSFPWRNLDNQYECLSDTDSDTYAQPYANPNPSSDGDPEADSHTTPKWYSETNCDT